MVALAAVTAIIIYYALNDPAAGGRAPRCVFKALTGFDCPGCGSQRALHALLNGRVAEAWRYNAMLFFLVPVAVAFGVAEYAPQRFPRLAAMLLRPVTIAALLALILGWWIARNIIGC